MPAKFSAKAAQGEHIQILRYRYTYRYTSNQSYSQSCPKPTTQYSVILVPSSQMNLHTSSNSTSTDSNDYPYELRSSKISSSVNRKLGTSNKKLRFFFFQSLIPHAPSDPHSDCSSLATRLDLATKRRRCLQTCHPANKTARKPCRRTRCVPQEPRGEETARNLREPTGGKK